MIILFVYSLFIVIHYINIVIFYKNPKFNKILIKVYRIFFNEYIKKIFY